MEIKSKKCGKRTYRFLPAYILLFLAEDSLYGSAILNEINKRMPGYNADSAAIYRSLQELEKAEFVKSCWKTEDAGPATKWYEITKSGIKKLEEYKGEIEQRKRNLEFFLKTYQSLNR